MRVSDDRYTRDRQKFDLALRLIRHEARTFTIRQWTGLSDDRIRKLYRKLCFGECAPTDVLRHRGKSPRQAAFFFRNPEMNFHAAQLASLFVMYGLVARQRSRCRNRAIAWARSNPVHCCAAPTRPIWKCTSRPAFLSSTRGFCCSLWPVTMRFGIARCAICGGVRVRGLVGKGTSWPCGNCDGASDRARSLSEHSA